MTPSRTPLISADHARAMAKARSRPLPGEEVEAYATGIEAALDAGDLDCAYERFQAWLVREARWAQHGHASNMTELVQTMLQLMGWMYERVPRTMAATAAAAA